MTDALTASSTTTSTTAVPNTVLPARSSVAITIVADDLTGAADAVGGYGAGRTTAVVVAPDTVRAGEPDAASRSDAWPDVEVLAVDTETRYRSGEDAAALVAAVVRRSVVTGRPVFKKIDSLLRGNVGTEVAAALGALVDPTSSAAGVEPERRALAVVAPAFPTNGRVTVGGVVLVDGAPHAASPFDGDVVRALAVGGLRSASTTAHGTTVIALASELERLHAEGFDAVVVDAAEDEDLERVARATEVVRVPVLVTGSGGLAAHVIAADAAAADTAPGGTSVRPETAAARVLVVIGSYSELARSQIDELRTVGVRHVELPLHQHAEQRTAALIHHGEPDEHADGAGHVVLTPELLAPVDKDNALVVAADLAATVALVAREFDALVLTGGETARAVLGALGTDTVRVLGELEPGVVLSRDPHHLPYLVTKAGAFGDAGTLARTVRALTAPQAPAPHTPEPQTPSHDKEHRDMKPIIAITMGDAAGVGPEIIAKAMADQEIRARATLFVVGDLRRLQLAMDVVGSALTINPITDPSEAIDEAGTIDVLDVAAIPADLPWGELSAEAGHGAFLFIEKAVELAMAGAIDAICTGPLNKAALHLGGHAYPGHTEMLAALAGVEEVSMMLTAPKMRVIHVTTHLGLVDAVARIDGDRVYRTIKRGNDLLVRSGIERPKIAVAAINPHAGENGLFGHGEEAEKVQPGVDRAQAEGLDVLGPLPADTLFFRAGRGDFDLVVAQYHDQGHIPVKVLGLKNGVNVTVGLPFVRTSVDHGTAFDIAGKDIVDHEPLLEALRQAADLSPVHAADHERRPLV